MVGLSAATVVAVLTRAPSSGGKRRLFAELQRPFDPALVEAMLLDTLDAVPAASLTRVVAVEPASSCEEVRAIVPPDVRVRAQGSGSIGDRMRDLMAALFADGAAAVILIGSDLPDLSADLVHRAADLLRVHPDALVLGPATDGGYYLIGATHLPDVFAGVEWGSSTVLEQTITAARRHGRAVELLHPLDDIDDVAALRRVRASRTAAWVDSHGRN